MPLGDVGEGRAPQHCFCTELRFWLCLYKSYDVVLPLFRSANLKSLEKQLLHLAMEMGGCAQL